MCTGYAPTLLKRGGVWCGVCCCGSVSTDLLQQPLASLLRLLQKVNGAQCQQTRLLFCWLLEHSYQLSPTCRARRGSYRTDSIYKSVLFLFYCPLDPSTRSSITPRPERPLLRGARRWEGGFAPYQPARIFGAGPWRSQAATTAIALVKKSQQNRAAAFGTCQITGIRF